MANEIFTITITGVDELAAKYPVAVRRGAMAGIEEGIELLEREVKNNILQGRDVLNHGPARFTGTLEDAIFHQMDAGAASPHGIVGVAPPADTYAIVQETGRTPGARMPPSSALLPWVIEKFGNQDSLTSKVVFMSPKGRPTKRRVISRSKLGGLAFVIARSIGRKGFPGVHMFRNAFETQQQNVVEIVRARITEAVAEDLK